MLGMLVTVGAQQPGGQPMPAPPDVEVPFFAMVLGMLVGLAILVVICALFYSALSRVPAEHRKMAPGLVWLLMIPVFNLVWNFFVVMRISESYQSYFRAQGKDVGDAGWGIGLAYAICAVVSLVPCLGVLAALASLVLLILYLVKVMGLRGEIEVNAE